MAKGSTFCAELLAQLFQGQPITALGLSSAGTATNLWLALHTADPTGGDQTANELSTTIGYTRTVTTRSSNGWAASGSTLAMMNLATQAFFPAISGLGAYSASFMSIGSSSAGAGQIYYSAALSPPFSNLGLNSIPVMTTGVTITES